jgi:hypothetical protein
MMMASGIRPTLRGMARTCIVSVANRDTQLWCHGADVVATNLYDCTVKEKRDKYIVQEVHPGTTWDRDGNFQRDG